MKLGKVQSRWGRLNRQIQTRKRDLQQRPRKLQALFQGQAWGGPAGKSPQCKGMSSSLVGGNCNFMGSEKNSGTLEAVVHNGISSRYRTVDERSKGLKRSNAPDGRLLSDRKNVSKNTFLCAEEMHTTSELY